MEEQSPGVDRWLRAGSLAVILAVTGLISLGAFPSAHSAGAAWGGNLPINYRAHSSFFRFDAAGAGPLFAFFLPLSRTPVPVNIAGLRSGGEVASAAVAALALYAKLGRAVTSADVHMFVISGREANLLTTDPSHDISEVSLGSRIGALDVFDAAHLPEDSCLLLQLQVPPLNGAPLVNATAISKVTVARNEVEEPINTMEDCGILARVQWAVFLHSNPANDWRPILDDQIRTYRTSPLYKCGAASRASTNSPDSGSLFYGFQRGTPWPFAPDPSFLPYKESNITAGLSNNEPVTLQSLFEWCADRPDALVAYIHDKGTRYSAVENPERFLKHWDWRRLHEYFIIENPHGCFRHLVDEKYDACGAEYAFESHARYDGNFWWARCSYIRQLAKPGTYRIGTQCSPERWISSNAFDEARPNQEPRARYYKCFNSNVNHYNDYYPLSKYAGKTCG